MNESSVSYTMFSPKDDKDTSFNSAMSCCLWMKAAGKSLFDAEAAAANL